MDRFDELDADGSGVLTSEDLELAAAAVASKAPASAKTTPSPPAAAARAAANASVETIDLAVSRGPSGFGVTLSPANVVTRIAAGGAADADGQLQRGDLVLGVDGQSLVDADGGALIFADVLSTLEPKPTYTFTVQRKRRPPSPAAIAATTPARALAPARTLLPEARSPSAPADMEAMRDSIAFAWGRLNLPRAQMAEFLQLVYGGDAQAPRTASPPPMPPAHSPLAVEAVLATSSRSPRLAPALLPPPAPPGAPPEPYLDS